MALQLINIGFAANDGTGDDLREAFIKVNNNFEELELRDYEETSAVNLGPTGEGVFANIVNYQLQFKKLVAGNDISLTATDTSITIDANGGLKIVTVNADSGFPIELTEDAVLNVVGGNDIVTRVVGGNLVIDYDGLSELAGDTSPQLSADLDGQGFDLTNIGNIDAAQVTGSFVGNLTGLVYGVDIRTISQYFTNYWDFGVIDATYSNVVDWLIADTNFDFGPMTNPTMRTIDGGSFI
jgi:hypothetical protein